MPEDKGKKKEEKMTPEEKLFRVIAAGGRDYVDFKEEDEESSKFQHLKFLKPLNTAFGKITKGIQNRMPGVWARAQEFSENLRHSKAPLISNWTKTLPPVSLKTLNKGFIVLAGILMLYLVGDMLFGQGRFNNMSSFNEPGRAPAMQIYPAFPREDVRPVSYYLTPVNNRNVFMPAGTQLAPAGAPGTDGQNQAQPAPVGYKLVGISWDDQGFVAMIEAPDEQGARFVRKGDVLPSGVKVKDVKNYSVLLSANGQKWELS